MTMYRHLATTLIALLVSGHASAAFYVDEEAPQQLAITTKPITLTKTVELSFSAKRAWISPAVRRALTEQLSVFATASDINIVASSASPNNLRMAEQRIDGIRQWLIENGIAGNRISNAEDPDKRPRDLADIVTLTVSARQVPVSPGIAAPRALNASLIRPVAPPPALVQAPPPPQPNQLEDKTKLALLQRIVAMGKNKIVKTEDAFNLIAEVLAMQDIGAAAPPTAPQPLVAPIPAPNPTVATLLAADIPRQWVLDSTKTLHANLDDWTRQAGYEPLNWLSPNQYSVGNLTITGSFYQALGDLAKAAPALNFTLSKARRTLTVTDATP